LGGGRFRIAPDRTSGSGATYLALRQPGTADVREVVQPANVDIQSLRNSAGKAQMITFPKLPDLRPDSPPVPLAATSDAGLPVQFYVVAGPAVVRDGRLVLTKIPPRAKFPVAVRVAAWQWGRAAEPKVRTADVVEQTVLIQP
jgi:hypothetical protein